VVDFLHLCVDTHILLSVNSVGEEIALILILCKHNIFSNAFPLLLIFLVSLFNIDLVHSLYQLLIQ
jgi:hypothetical protein